MGLNRNEDRINFCQVFGIVEAKHPAPIRFTVHVEDAEIHGMGFLFRLIISLSPDLECAGVLHPGLVIEIEGVVSSSGLVNVLWNGEVFSVFNEDLQEKAHLVNTTSI